MLCMSTSLRKGHRPARCANAPAIVLAVLLAASMAHADAQRESGAPAARQNAAVRLQLANDLVAQLEQESQLPGPGPVVTGTERSVRVSAGKSTAWLTPVQVRYRSLSNRYCLLAVSDEETKQTRLVPLPAAALRDTCRKISAQFLVDANGSGPHDVVQAVQIQSNRGNFEVTEALVYLSDSLSDSGYCYSSQASRELAPEHLFSAKAASAALSEARVRLGLKAFACDR